MVLDRAYLPAAFEPYERQTEIPCFYFSFSLTKDSIIHLCFAWKKGLTPYQRVYFADKANYYVGQAQYIPVYTTSEKSISIS
jgi:hypothetical protein